MLIKNVREHIKQKVYKIYKIIQGFSDHAYFLGLLRYAQISDAENREEEPHLARLGEFQARKIGCRFGNGVPHRLCAIRGEHS